MSLRGRKLGVLVACHPSRPGFRHAVSTAGAALREGVDVYLYCIDEAVAGIDDAALQKLKSSGLKLYACAYGAQRRNLAASECAAFAGLTVVNDLIAATDRFLAFT